jgi:HNH endonuclease
MPKHCSIHGCTRTHYARGLCKPHYRQTAEQQAKTREYRDRPEVQAKRREQNRKRNKRRRAYIVAKGRAASDAKKDWGAWWERQRRIEDRADLAEHDREQRQRRRNARHCCHTRQQSKARQWIAGRCPDCNHPIVVIRGWWNDSIRCPECTKARWRETHYERAERYGVPFNVVNPRLVFERDKYRCQICGRKTTGKAPNPRSPSLDHIIPMSCGGAHSMDNLQCACLTCNARKGARAANDQLRLAV